MATTLTIDPVTRIEGHLKIAVTVDAVNGRPEVVDARATGTLFRGFETILQGRNPFDAPDITARICGVCPTPHNEAAVSALDVAMGIQVPDNGRILRNLVLAADFLHSHILHFYHLAVLDFIVPPAMAPWQPAFSADIRFDAATSEALVGHYVTALEMRRKAHEMGAVFGGRLPHTGTFLGGGFSAVPKADSIARFRSYAAEILGFVHNVYIPDVEAVARAYSDYLQIGAGPRNLLAFGVFDEDGQGANRLLRRGRIEAGAATVLPVDTKAIAEDVTSSWYSDRDGLNPASGNTTPAYPKTGGYSWIKSPRYGGKVYEVGPLARMAVNGDYSGGVSVMDRHQARAAEALKIATALDRWLNELVDAAPVFADGRLAPGASGIGLTEAPRGALGHWMAVGNAGTIARYQIVTPTCWNASPRDARGVSGALEQALVGTPVADIAQPVEVLRVIHSFDPCLSCAVHVLRPGGAAVAVHPRTAR